MVVPLLAGVVTDVLACVVAEKLKDNYARGVIIENRVGASGRIGVEAVKHADPDGNTLLFTPDFLMTVDPHSFKNLSYDPLIDFIPIQIFARSGLPLAAGPGMPDSRCAGEGYITGALGPPSHAHYAS